MEEEAASCGWRERTGLAGTTGLAIPAGEGRVGPVEMSELWKQVIKTLAGI